MKTDDDPIRDSRDLKVSPKTLEDDQLSAMYCLDLGYRYPIGGSKILAMAIQDPRVWGRIKPDIEERPLAPLEIIILGELIRGYAPKPDGTKRYLTAALRTNSTLIGLWVNCDPRKCKAALHSLEERGLITKTHRGGNQVEVHINWNGLHRRMRAAASLLEHDQVQESISCTPRRTLLHPWIIYQR